MGPWELLILLYGPMRASHLVKTKRTLTDELPTSQGFPVTGTLKGIGKSVIDADFHYI